MGGREDEREKRVAMNEGRFRPFTLGEKGCSALTTSQVGAIFGFLTQWSGR